MYDTPAAVNFGRGEEEVVESDGRLLQQGWGAPQFSLLILMRLGLSLVLFSGTAR